jgi:CheY-like chemotaxis protein
LTKHTILLVEDEEAVRAVALLILQRHYTVLEARDGEEALEVSRRWAEPIDLLLTDVLMPRLNGQQLADRLRPERPGMRILFMSGCTGEVNLDAPDQPAGAFLSKPFTPDTLVHKVREVLSMDQGN